MIIDKDEQIKKKRRRNIKMFIALGVILALIIFLLTDTGKQFWSLFQMTGGDLKEYVESKGKWAPWFFFLISYFQVVIAPIPGQVTYFVGGLLFGTWVGFLINHTATILGSITVYWLARAFGEPLVDKLAGKGKAKKAVDFVKRNGPIFFLLAFIIPGLPDDLLCYVAGMVNLPFAIFIVLVSVARIPSTLASSILGEGMMTWTTTQTIIVVGIMAAVIAIIIVFRKKITGLLNKLVRKTGKDKNANIEDMME